MNRFIVLFLLLVFCSTPFCFAQKTYKYVEYGGRMELIVKTQPKNYWFGVEKKTYGIRKNGVVVLPPEYSADEVAFPADVFLLVFMNSSEKTVYVYSVEDGEEVFRHVSSEADGQTFCGFVFRKIGARCYALLECFNLNGELNCKTIRIFQRYRGETRQLEP